MVKTKILFLSANPDLDRPLDLDSEYTKIKQEYKKSKNQEDFDFTLPILSATFEKLKNELEFFKKNEPIIIHFCGHGMGKRGLVLNGNNQGKEVISTDRLEAIFEFLDKYNYHIRLVILNACFSEVQANAIIRYAKYVICTNYSIEDEKAIYFSEYFYRFLFAGKSIEESFDFAVLDIGESKTTEFENHLSRAVFDPASDDIIKSDDLKNKKYIKLLVNKDKKDLENPDSNVGFPQPNKLISDRQWNNLESILELINDFEIIKDVCRLTLKEDIQINIENVEQIILSLKTLGDLKKVLETRYARTDKIPAIYFAHRLRNSQQIERNEREEIDLWFEEIEPEKRENLPELQEQLELPQPTQLEESTSHLLIVIKKRRFDFSLEAELVLDYQRNRQNYEFTPISSDEQPTISIDELRFEEIATHLSILVKEAEKHTSNFIVELFVPGEYVGKCFDRYKVFRRHSGNHIENLEPQYPLGSQYPSIIRCSERYSDLRLYNALKEKWRKLELFLKENQENCQEINEYCKLMTGNPNWKKLFTKWDRNLVLSVNIIDQLPSDENQEKYFMNFIDSCVPLALWSRNQNILCNCNDDTDLTIKEKFQELLDSISLQDLSQLFRNIHYLREDAHNEGDIAEQYLGYHLGFICDRPYLVPYTFSKYYIVNK